MDVEINGIIIYVVNCSDLPVKEPDRLIGVDRVMTLGSLGDISVSTPAQRCGFDSCFKCNISHFHHPFDPGSMTRIIDMLSAVCLLKPLCILICKYNPCM